MKTGQKVTIKAVVKFGIEQELYGEIKVISDKMVEVYTTEGTMLIEKKNIVKLF